MILAIVFLLAYLFPQLAIFLLDGGHSDATVSTSFVVK